AAPASHRLAQPAPPVSPTQSRRRAAAPQPHRPPPAPPAFSLRELLLMPAPSVFTQTRTRIEILLSLTVCSGTLFGRSPSMVSSRRSWYSDSRGFWEGH